MPATGTSAGDVRLKDGTGIGAMLTQQREWATGNKGHRADVTTIIARLAALRI